MMMVMMMMTHDHDDGDDDDDNDDDDDDDDDDVDDDDADDDADADANDVMHGSKASTWRESNEWGAVYMKYHGRRQRPPLPCSLPKTLVMIA